MELITDYQRTFLTEHGRRVLTNMMNRHYVIDSEFDPDPYVHAFKSGQKAVLAEIFKVLKIDVIALQNRILEEERDAT